MKNKDVNIIKFEPKQKSVLSQEEIMKVFAGLVRLIQKSAEYTAMEKLKSKLEYYIERLNQTTLELNKRNKQLNELLELNESLIAQIQNNENQPNLL